MQRFASTILLSLSVCLLASLVPANAAEPTHQERATVLITGANRGIGLGFVRSYGERGWRVIATCRDPAQATELAEFANEHPNVSIMQLDVSSASETAALAQALNGQPIDLLINNAGTTGNVRNQSVGKLDMAEFAQVLAVNTIGPLRVAEALLPNVMAGKQKKIVNLSTSEASFGMDRGPARIPFYRSSKSALNMLMLNYAKMVADRGVTVLLVNPGPVDTDMMKGAGMKLASVDSAVGQIVPLMDQLSLADSGKFWNFDGKPVPW